MNKKPFIEILGAGPAGLSAGYFASNADIPIRIFEGTNEVGGNCRTIHNGKFSYDTGAHRFHDKQEDITSIVKDLLGDDLLKVEAPSQIYTNGKMIDFPLNISNVLHNLNTDQIVKIITENMLRLAVRKNEVTNFQELAYETYGKTLSDMFLINYTEKLWGQPADKLDSIISGGRLKNLDPISLIKHKLFGAKKHKNIDGSFYYPRHGFGSIFETISNIIGSGSIVLNSPVSQMTHDGNKITGLFCGDKKFLDPHAVISTLPIDTMIKIMNPMPPDEILSIAESVKYRHLRICILFLNIPFFSRNASIYFPEKKYNFTRIYEPKNRSAEMAPQKQTCIVIESPCDNDEELSKKNKIEYVKSVTNSLISMNLIKEEQIITSKTHTMKNAYPVLDVSLKKRKGKMLNFVERFGNLYVLGRNAKFEYLHTHDIFIHAKRLINKISEIHRGLKH